MIATAHFAQLLRRGILLSLLTLLCSVAAQAQLEGQTTATVQGVVRDTQGSAIANAEVSIATDPCICSSCSSDCDCCPGSKSFTTGDTGNYSFSVQPGIYNITAKFLGSSATMRADVQIGRAVTVDITIPPPSLNATVTIVSNIEVKGKVKFLGKQKTVQGATVMLIPEDCDYSGCPDFSCCSGVIRGETKQSGEFALDVQFDSDAELGVYTLVTVYRNYTQIEPVKVKVRRGIKVNVELLIPPDKPATANPRQ